MKAKLVGNSALHCYVHASGPKLYAHLSPLPRATPCVYGILNVQLCCRMKKGSSAEVFVGSAALKTSLLPSGQLRYPSQEISLCNIFPSYTPLFIFVHISFCILMPSFDQSRCGETWSHSWLGTQAHDAKIDESPKMTRIAPSRHQDQMNLSRMKDSCDELHFLTLSLDFWCLQLLDLVSASLNLFLW